MNPDEDFCRWCGAPIVGAPIRFRSMPFDRIQCANEFRAKHGTEDFDER